MADCSLATAHDFLGKDRAMQALKLCKALVEGHELKACRESEGSEVRVAPDFGRKGPALRVFPPERLDVRGLFSQKHPRLPEAPRRARRLVDNLPVDRTARAAIGLDVENWADPLLTAPCRTPSPPHPPAAGVRPPEPRRRYGRDQEFP